MNDRQNCMELCGDVVDAYRDDGLRLERALAMLHKLTTPGHTEPYLGDQPEAEWSVDFGKIHENLRYEPDPDLQEWLDVATDLATHQWSTEIEDLEDAPISPDEATLLLARTFGPPERRCPICDGVLERRPRESFAEYARRETDSKSCAGQLRSRKNRAAKEAVMG